MKLHQRTLEMLRESLGKLDKQRFEVDLDRDSEVLNILCSPNSEYRAAAARVRSL